MLQKGRQILDGSLRCLGWGNVEAPERRMENPIVSFCFQPGRVAFLVGVLDFKDEFDLSILLGQVLPAYLADLRQDLAIHVPDANVAKIWSVGM